MVRLIKKLSLLTASGLLCLTLVVDSWGQSDTRSSSNFGSTAIQGIQSRNSASRYSVQNIQAGLRTRSASSVGVRGVNQRNFLGNSSSPMTQRSKPFSSLSKGPSVSPYLSLSAPRASASDYYSIIRPQQKAQRENQRQQAYAIQQQRRLNQLAARAPFSTTGDENSAPTGHVAVFQSLGSYQNTGNYFPPPSAPKRR